MSRKRPCSICRKWFHPDPRVGARQRCCLAASCQEERRRGTQAAWRADNADYFTARRLRERTTPATESSRPVDPPRPPRPLDRLPWDIAQDEFGAQGAEFLLCFGRVLRRYAQDQRAAQTSEIAKETGRVIGSVAQDQIGGVAGAPAGADHGAGDPPNRAAL